MNPFELAARDLQIARHGGAGSYNHCVELGCESIVTLHRSATFEFDALLLEDIHATVDYRLVELEVRDTVAQQSAGSFVLIENGYGVTLHVERLGCTETSGTGTYHSDLLAVS